MDIVKKITDDVVFEINTSKIHLPENYSAENAIQAAFLTLKGVVDKTNRPALEVCTPESIAKTILSMVIQGLNPAKEQCYFIVYGRTLKLMRSYLGGIAVAKRVEKRLKDVRAQVVYEEDDFDYEIVDGLKKVLVHKQSLKSSITKNIIGAYALAIDQNDNVAATEIMDFDLIKKSWKKSKQHPVLSDGKLKEGTTHAEYPERMAKRTVIARLCKDIISTSDDERLLLKALETDEDITVEEEINIHANKKLLDFDPPEKESEPKPEMVDKSTIVKLYKLEEKAGRKEKILQTLSGFVGRTISGLTELTATEANNYIKVVEDELSNEPEEMPDWG